METKTGLLDSPFESVVKADQEPTSRWLKVIEQTARLRWFLTPARLAISLVMFSLGLWSHSAYNSQVRFQNTQLLERQLSRANQHIGLLTTRLTASEAQLAGARADFESHLDLMGKQLRTMQRDIASSQRAIQQLNVRHSRQWQQLHQEFDRERRLDDAQLDQLRWETERSFGLLARRLDAMRDQTVSANRAIEATNHGVAMVRALQDRQTDLIDRTHRQLDVLRRWSDYMYVPFDVRSKNHPQSVDPIRVELKKTNVTKQRYNAILYLGNTEIKKKDRTVNELVTFTVGDEKRPYQFVVKQVARDRIVGYLGVPKDINPRTGSASEPEQENESRRVGGREPGAAGSPF